MKAQYTPGPWIAQGFDVQAGKGGRTSICIAHNVPGNVGMGSRSANARLISAAPELLEALQKMLKPFQGGCLCGHFESCPVCSRSPDECEAARLAKDAIAKATGEIHAP